MEHIDIVHLDHIKEQILDGIKMETRKTILDTHSISDQLNAVGDEQTQIRSTIAGILGASKAKAAQVSAAKTFEELEQVVPRMIE